MDIQSVNVGEPREVEIDGRLVRTAIVKRPVPGRVRVERLNIEGDRQADPRVHGGEDMAVYAYPIEHYAYWEEVLGRDGLPCGQFGENLTVRGLHEDEVRIGDVFRAGSVTMQVTQPRFPCFKLAWRMGEPRAFVKRFLESRRLGFYLRVLEEGMLGAGDQFDLEQRNKTSVSVAELIECARFDTANTDALERALASPGLAARLHDQLERALAAARGKT